MAFYPKLRKYEVPAANRIQVPDRIMKAPAFPVEKDFHVMIILRTPAAKPEQGKPAGWLTLIMRQLTGK